MNEDQEPVTSCPVCASPLGAADEVHACPRCETPHHSECWDYVGACAIFGCTAQAVALAAPAPTAPGIFSAVGFSATGTLLSAFTWVLRLHWWSFALMNLSLSLLAAAFFWMPFAQVFAVFLPFVTMLGLAAYLVLTVPLLLLQGLLHTRLSFSFKAPKKGIRAVLDRVEFAPAESLAKRIADGAPWAYKWACGLGCLWSAGLVLLESNPETLMVVAIPAAMGILFGYLPIAFLASGTQERLTFVATVQNRLIASTKGHLALPS